jgi:hypothetical protein
LLGIALQDAQQLEGAIGGSSHALRFRRGLLLRFQPQFFEDGGRQLTGRNQGEETTESECESCQS